MRSLLVLLLLLGGCQSPPSGGASPTVSLTRGTGTIVAGKSVDEVALGQSQAEVEKALGAPSETYTNEFNKKNTNWLYHQKGLEIAFDSGKVAMIVCNTADPFTPYTGATADGLWVGSTMDEVRKALGEPKEKEELALKYDGAGVWFTFKDGKVETIRVIPAH